MKAVVVINQTAGAFLGGAQDGPHSKAVQEVFAAHGVSIELETPQAGRVRETISAARMRHPDAIFVGGGDGTVSTAAGCLVGGDIPLGVLPLGTLNHFARDLGLPLNWQETVSALAQGGVRQVDVGTVNGRTFINNCSIGSYAEAVRKRDALRFQQGTRKKWAMVLATVTVFLNLRRLRISIRAEPQMLSLRTPFVVVANNRYSGRVLDYSLRPRLDEGRLWIYTTRAGRRPALLWLILQTLVRKIDGGDNLETLASTDAIISSESGAAAVALDGELVHLEWPLQFSVRRAALPVLVPHERYDAK